MLYEVITPMSLLDVLRGWAGQRKDAKIMRMLSGGVPVFSQFGTDIYASDIVQNCINVIATEMSKLQPRHIRNMEEEQNVPNGNRITSYNVCYTKLLRRFKAGSYDALHYSISLITIN